VSAQRKGAALGALVWVACLLLPAAPVSAAANPSLVVWAGPLSPQGELHGVQLGADGKGKRLIVGSKHRVAGKVSGAGSFSPSPAELAAIRQAAKKAFAAPGVKVAPSKTIGSHGGYASAVVAIGGKTRTLIGIDTSAPPLHALLTALNAALPEANRLQDPKTGLAEISTAPPTSPCPSGQGPTTVSRRLSLAEAAQLGAATLTAKGGFAGDAVAVDAKWVPTDKPVTVRVNIEFSGYPGGPSAAQVEATIEKRLTPRIASDGTKVKFDVVARQRAAGTPPSPCFHEVQLVGKNAFRDYSGYEGPSPLVTPEAGEWGAHGAENAQVWTHETLHFAGLGDRYRDYYQVGKKLFPLPPNAGDEKGVKEWVKAHKKELEEAAKSQKLKPGAGAAISKALPGHAKDIMGTGSKLLQIDVDTFAAIGAEELTVEGKPGDLLLNKVATAQNLAVGAPFELTVSPGKDGHADGLVAYCIDLEKHSPDAGQGYDVLGQAGAQSSPSMQYVQRILEVSAALQPAALQETPGIQGALWRVTNDNTIYIGDQAEAEAILALVGVPDITFEAPHFPDPNAGSPATAGVTTAGILPPPPPTPFVRIVGVRPHRLRAGRHGQARIAIVVAGTRTRVQLELQRWRRSGWQRVKRFQARSLPPGRTTIRLHLPTLRRGAQRIVAVGPSTGSPMRLHVRGYGRANRRHKG